MEPHELIHRPELIAVLICPNRALAQQFVATIPETRSFHVAADLDGYPNARQLDSRLRQLRPDVVLLDLSADTEKAVELISVIAAIRPTIHVVGLHEHNDAAVIIRSLRAGSTEFLCSPFDAESQSTVIARVLRLRQSDDQSNGKRAQVFSFVGAKAGQGVTTLAYHSAIIGAEGGKRKVLVIDFDLTGGTLSFIARVSCSYSLLDAIRHSDKIDATLWSALVTNHANMDLLAAPDKPEPTTIEAHRVHDLVEYARGVYDVVILDLPAAYERVSQVALGESDKIFLVSGAELPALHLTRKLIAYLEQMQIGRERMSLIVNRIRGRQGLGTEDMEKVFAFPISSVLPEDHSALHRAQTTGKPVPWNCDLGRSLKDFGEKLFAVPAPEKKKGVGALKLSALLSQG